MDMDKAGMRFISTLAQAKAMLDESDGFILVSTNEKNIEGAVKRIRDTEDDGATDVLDSRTLGAGVDCITSCKLEQAAVAAVGEDAIRAGFMLMHRVLDVNINMHREDEEVLNDGSVHEVTDGPSSGPTSEIDVLREAIHQSHMASRHSFYKLSGILSGLQTYLKNSSQATRDVISHTRKFDALMRVSDPSWEGLPDHAESTAMGMVEDLDKLRFAISEWKEARNAD